MQYDREEEEQDDEEDEELDEESDALEKGKQHATCSFPDISIQPFPLQI